MNEVDNEDEFFNLKLPSIEKIAVTEKEFETTLYSYRNSL